MRKGPYAYKRKFTDDARRNLFIAVLCEAWCDALKPIHSRAPLRSRKDKNEAVMFMEGVSRRWDESFADICRAADVHPGFLREGYFRFKAHWKNDKAIHPEDAFNWLMSSLVEHTGN